MEEDSSWELRAVLVLNILLPDRAGLRAWHWMREGRTLCEASKQTQAHPMRLAPNFARVTHHSRTRLSIIGNHIRLPEYNG